jgi:hypothetical protein
MTPGHPAQLRYSLVSLIASSATSEGVGDLYSRPSELEQVGVSTISIPSLRSVLHLNDSSQLAKDHAGIIKETPSRLASHEGVPEFTPALLSHIFRSGAREETSNLHKMTNLLLQRH